MWPDEGVEQGFIYARSLPEIGNWINFTPQKIGNIMKNYSIEKPNPKTSEHIYTF